MKKLNLNTPGPISVLLALILLFNTKGVLEQYMIVSGESAPWQWVYNAIALVALDIAVFLFAIRGMTTYALLYAGAILLVNFRPILLLPGQPEGAGAVYNMVVDRFTLGIVRLSFAGGIFIFSEIFAEMVKGGIPLKAAARRVISPDPSPSPAPAPAPASGVIPPRQRVISPALPDEGKLADLEGKFPHLAGKSPMQLADRRKYLRRTGRIGPELEALDIFLAA